MSRDSYRASRSGRRRNRPGSVVVNMSSLVRGFGRYLQRLLRNGRQRFTIMFIPHSEKRVVNLQLSAFVLVLIGVASIVVLGWFVYLATVFSGTERVAGDTSSRLEETEADLEAVRQEVLAVLQVYQEFEHALSGTLQRLDISSGGDIETPLAGGDLAAILNLTPVHDGELRERAELQRVATSLRASMAPLSEVSEELDRHRQLLSDIPNLWPVQNGLGHVTLEFGPNIHPITGTWHMHKGIQISYYPGTPVIAAANGTVTGAGFDAVGGYGGFVELNHNYGFRTRYAHLADVVVREGEQVIQGQRIGTMGTTGLSTGTHVDFQIWIGTENIDPIYFLRLSRPDFDRRARGRL